MAVKEKKSKEAVMRAAMASRGKRKKWVKVKTKDKVNNAVFFEKATVDRLMTEIPKAKLITISTIVDKLKVNGSLARQALAHLEEQNLIKPVCDQHHQQRLYTRV
ncbi:ribosomal protein S25, putative [Babesia bigemina]|uniref:40S ribosomal protein S25 n=1 Tax=Babesia bigemina TaxID=5866 RepID=A0A061D307_BABBI|nr:ribosomal protein S25, putative [Babesia bigemina]CDR94482.1 ribosomal protein S25, putative [Babesia bigemina]|eukprot:XP_012766668.1 ribosomal protein S25, putative [Babesia bigemina]